MSTIEEFETAPVGATATNSAAEHATKAWQNNMSWFVYEEYSPSFSIVTNDEMARRNFTLNPGRVPANAREALDLAWELGHEVKEGQTIPSRTECIQNEGDSFGRITTPRDWTPVFREYVRTLDPLPEPEPEPDWLNAPAVLASHPLCADTEQIGLWLPIAGSEGLWEWPRGEFTCHWSDLEEVTPLYPKGQDTPRSYSARLNYDGPWGTRLGGDPA